MDLRHAPRTLLSLGAVNVSGIPVTGQVAVWNDLDTLEGSANFTFVDSTSTLTVGIGSGAELLVDGDFSSFANWTDVGDVSEGTLAYDYLFGISSGTLTQANATLAVAPKNNTLYEFTYTISNEVGSVNNIEIATPFASVATDLPIADGTQTVQFTSGVAADVADFVISFAGNGTNEAFTIDDVTLKEVIQPAVAWGSDVFLFRDGPWELGLRDGTHDNFFYVYGTFTDANNYERLAVYAGSPINHIIESQTAGTGGDNINLTVRPAGSGLLTLGVADTGTTIQMHGGLIISRQFAQTRLLSNSATVSTPSGQTATATNLIPAGCMLIGVTSRVLTAVTGPAGFDIGDGVDVDRFGNSISVGLGTTTNIINATTSAITTFQASNDVVLTSDGADFTGGSVKLVAHYISITAPT